MSTGKIYALNVEPEVEGLSSQLAGFRARALATLAKARTEYEQIAAWQAATERKKGRQSDRNGRQVGEQIEGRIEETFENLVDALPQIRKPFRK